jgi:hypothetical protein
MVAVAETVLVSCLRHTIDMRCLFILRSVIDIALLAVSIGQRQREANLACRSSSCLHLKAFIQPRPSTGHVGSNLGVKT